MTLATDNEIGYTMGATPMEPAGDFYFPHLHTFGPKGPISTRGFSRIRWRSNQTVVLIGPFGFWGDFEMSNDFPELREDVDFAAMSDEEFYTWPARHPEICRDGLLLTAPVEWFLEDNYRRHITNKDDPSAQRKPTPPRAKPATRAGVIYFIKPDDGPCKIGFTTNLERRFTTIQAQSPLPLTIIHTFAGTLADEAGLHERFKDRRLHGEWFDLTDEDIEALKREFDG